MIESTFFLWKIAVPSYLDTVAPGFVEISIQIAMVSWVFGPMARVSTALSTESYTKDFE